MFGGLQQRISLPTGRRRLFAAEPGAKTIQLSMQLTPEPIDCFQGERQFNFFGGGLERKPLQQFHQPLPHQRSGQRVTRQSLSQNKRKSFSATATPPSVGTKHPLAPDGLATGLNRIIAAKDAVPVQGLDFPAAGAALLFERKSWVSKSSTSLTK
jgi:hypothetical protein